MPSPPWNRLPVWAKRPSGVGVSETKPTGARDSRPRPGPPRFPFACRWPAAPLQAAPGTPGPAAGLAGPGECEEPRNLPPGRCSWPRLGTACSRTRSLLRGACASPWVLPALFMLLVGSQLPSLPPPPFRGVRLPLCFSSWLPLGLPSLVSWSVSGSLLISGAVCPWN